MKKSVAMAKQTKAFEELAAKVDLLVKLVDPTGSKRAKLEKEESKPEPEKKEA